MGDVAEAMLDGTLCACCGDLLCADTGYPVYCPGCAPSMHQQPKGVYITRTRPRGPASKPKPCVCLSCGKPFASKAARRAHNRAMHNRSAPVAAKS